MTFSAHPYRAEIERDQLKAEKGPECACGHWALDPNMPDGVKLPHHPKCPLAVELTTHELALLVCKFMEEHSMDGATQGVAIVEWAIHHRLETAKNTALSIRTREAAETCEALAVHWEGKGNVVAGRAARTCALGIRAMDGNA